MRLEMDNNVSITTVVIVAIVALVLISIHEQCEKTIRTFIEKGYTQKQNPGTCEKLWIKEQK